MFIYFGTLIPWTEYALGTNLAFWRMIVLAILILAFKRLPWIVAMYRIIPALQDRNQAIFTGWCVVSHCERVQTDLAPGTGQSACRRSTTLK